MQHYYTYEYGWVDADVAVYVYRSKDGLVGLRVKHLRSEGLWNQGYSRFFVWDDESDSDGYEWEWEARKALKDDGLQSSVLVHSLTAEQSSSSTHS